MSDLYKKVSSSIDTNFYPFHQDEWFTQLDVCSQFDWRDLETRHAVSQKLYNDRIAKPPVIEKRNKTYRVIDREIEEIDWMAADSSKTLDIILPFDLHQYVKFFPKSIIVVAGSGNAGKTAFLYNFIMDNMGKHIITLYNSETSPEQMKDRFSNFEMKVPNPPPFRTIFRMDNFADVIDPDGWSVVDYVDADSEFYQKGIEIRRIFRKLNTGCAIIGLQKKSNFRTFKGQLVKQKLGYGGDTTLKRASLYLAMDKGHIEIVKGKSWVDNTQNPDGMAWDFKLVNGCKFVNIERDYSEE